jgi:broad specificity phosphatase PhoE
MDAFALLMRRPAAAAGSGAAGQKRARPAESVGDAVVDLSRDDDSDGDCDRGAAAVANKVPRRVPTLLSGAPPKRLVLIRHGETNGYHLRDTDLSPVGRAQAGALGTYSALAGVEAVVVSPLTRALQTAVLAFAHGRQLDARLLPGGGTSGGSALVPPDGGAADSNSSAAVSTSSQQSSSALPALPLYVTHLARELAGTKGDVGTDWRAHHPSSGAAVPAASSSSSATAGRPVPPELRPLLPTLAGLPQRWWALHHSGTAAAGGKASASPSSSSASSPADDGAAQAQLAPESRESLRRRVAALRDALRALPHRTVAVVAHAHTLRELGQLPSALGFCEVRVVSLAM